MSTTRPAAGALRRLVTPLVFGLALLASAAAVEAKVHKVTLDPALYGNLDQKDTDCPKFGCGPTAAINSFVFLQNQHPEIYGTSLIPGTVVDKTTGKYSYPAGVLKNAANVLAGNPYMGSCLPCGPNDGTYIEDFAIGKYDYLEKMAKGKTVYHAQIGIKWRETIPAGDGTHPNTKKPAWVQDETLPTTGFLLAELGKKQDIELFLTGPTAAGGTFSHYVTLTGIEFDDVKKTGSISIIDPDGGVPATYDFKIENGRIRTTYGTGGQADIFHAIAESPVPEPGTWLLLLGGGSVALLVVRRRTAVMHPPRSREVIATLN
jgi:hypothetical protein